VRSPKIKIPKIDLSTFAAENLSIDPFWDDLIANGDKSYKNERRNRRLNEKRN
jgi:hypothetical protein